MVVDGAGLKKVMVVEDKSELAEMYRAKLSKHFAVSVVGEGSAVIDEIRRVRPDLVLLDLMLPGELNGMDILRLIRRDGEIKDTRVVIISSIDPQAMPGMDEDYLDYLDKGNIELETLAEKVGQYVV